MGTLDRIQRGGDMIGSTAGIDAKTSTQDIKSWNFGEAE